MLISSSAGWRNYTRIPECDNGDIWKFTTSLSHWVPLADGSDSSTTSPHEGMSMNRIALHIHDLTTMARLIAHATHNMDCCTSARNPDDTRKKIISTTPHVHLQTCGTQHHSIDWISQVIIRRVKILQVGIITSSTRRHRCTQPVGQRSQSRASCRN